MKRRSLLALSAAALAGCSSLTGADGPSEPLQVGEDALTDGGLRLAVESVAVETRFQTSGGEFEADAGELFVFVGIAAENAGDEPQSLPAPDEFAVVAGGEQQGPFENPAIQPPEGVGDEPYAGGEQRRPGVGDEGWLMFPVSGDVDGAVLSWFDGASGAEELRWNLDLSEHMAEVPRFEFAGFALPETAAVGEPVEVAFKIENTGGSAGDVDVMLVVEGPVRDEAELTATVSPGERTRLGRTYTPEEPGELAVTVYPFEATERVVLEEES